MFKMRLLLLLMALVALSTSTGHAEVEIESCGIPMNRLPPLFEPQKYQLTLEPNLKTQEFKGSVDILTTFTNNLGDLKMSFCNVIKEVCVNAFSCGMNRCGLTMRRRILLNVGKTLEIDEVRVYKLDQEGSASIPLAIESMCIDRGNQLLQVVLSRKLKAKDKISIKIDYRGHIAKESRGLYESLNRVEGQALELTTNANTHFFPADARSTFPSFDQPDMKATFSLKLIHDKNLVSISNTKVASEVIDEKSSKKHVQFVETPKMSTYVFAFAIGQYETISCQAEGMARPVVTAYAPLGRSHEAEFTMQTVCKAIPLVEQYFHKEFPLTKLDLVVTRQMRDPARENWGMIVFTEEFLLTDSDTTNVLRAEIAKLSVHNVLHHWFGDLVTAKWWDDQWIFDGFTIWRSHLVAAQIYPELDYNFNYLLRLQSPILDAHSTEGVHAIKTYQDLSADEELALFDANTYNKAAAIYQMAQGLLGEYLFRDSLAVFVSRHSYEVADVSNFTDAIEESSTLNLKQIIESWINQAGVPMVSVERIGQDTIELRQERLLEASSADAKKQRWIIPIEIYFTDGGVHETTIRVTLDSDRMRVKEPVWFNNFDHSHWFKLNTNFSGLYRVKYAENVLKHLEEPVKQEIMSPEDRFNIIDDLRALFNLGKVSTKELEDILKWYEDETSGGVLSGLAVVVKDLAKKESSPRVAEIVHRLFDQVYEISQFKDIDGQSHAEMNGRQDALLELILYDYEDAIEEALQVFEATDVHLAPFLRKPVYLAVLRRGSESQVNELFGRLAQTKSSYERQILVQGLLAYLDKGDEDLKQRLSALIES